MENNQKGLLLVISGSAGTGKGTVISEMRRLAPERFEYSVSATTRAPRPGEVNGVQYHFTDREGFEKLIADGKMLEYTQYSKNYYGTPKSELAKLESGKNLILEIEVEGAANVKRLVPESVTVFIAPPDLTTLEARLRGRGTNAEDDILRRMATAKEEMKRIPCYDYVIVNEDGKAEEAAEKILGILDAEMHRTNRNEALLSRLCGKEDNQ